MRRESQGSAASAGNEGDLRLNLAPQLVRRAVQLCRELSDPAAVVAAAPGGGRDGPPDGEGLAAEQHRDAPRFTALRRIRTSPAGAASARPRGRPRGRGRRAATARWRGATRAAWPRHRRSA
ncbi:unnamed protein product [Prorocentrum cordatum]|uniref:Uncharacterized protein n=1 Tax=Prorocentrum cordatum TaxID=2364126 RepID=A0ABN9VGZ2_9DINO|nr:unnamed protein product [Polarella glacialis]